MKRISTKTYFNVIKLKIIKNWLLYLYEAGLITNDEYENFLKLTTYVDEPYFK